MPHRGPDDAGYALFSLRVGAASREKNFWLELTEDEFKHRNVHIAPVGSDYARAEIEANRWHLLLGHRRLAIIDLSARGHQPMANRAKSVWVVFNGEIYNFREIRAELEGAGFGFYSRSDTEVILHSYQQWGIDCVRRFNGMFALALWDNDLGKLFLARDRFGVKPLYYCYDGRYCIFASEIKAILASGYVARGLDYRGFAEYFAFQNIFTDRTLFAGIRMLPAGSHLELDVRREVPRFSSVQPARYWDYSYADALGPGDLSEAECARELRERFERAVERQLVSDVPVGSYLSGGMDSGSIAAVARRKIPRLMTFTGGFDLASVSGLEANFDERAAAELMASRFGTEHYEMVMHSGDMIHILPKLIWHLEDLRVGMCWQNFYIARLASRFVKAVLAGTGGDELFAGYPWRYRHVAEAANGAEALDRYYRYWQRLIPEERRGAFFSADSLGRMGEPAGRQIVQEIFEAPGACGNLVLNALYFELKTFLHGLFVVEDKLSMANSLETRVPFLDNDLVDFSLRIPVEYKVKELDLATTVEENVVGQKDRYRELSNAGKHVLRRAMEGLIPPEILTRNKQGFSPPDESWYKGPTMEYIRSILFSDQARARPYFNMERVASVLEEHIAGKVNHRLLIWSLLCFEWWNRNFLDA
jgi:asparagine synthase (glutamine-hydrolysing)